MYNIILLLSDFLLARLFIFMCLAVRASTATRKMSKIIGWFARYFEQKDKGGEREGGGGTKN